MPEKISKIKKTAEKKPKTVVKTDRYFEAVGRRKTTVARVRIYPKKSGITVNDRELNNYFATSRLQKIVFSPFEKMKVAEEMGVAVKVQGGGITGQAEAIRLGISRALAEYNPEFRKRLKRLGFLMRDSRMVERKKYGLKKARRAPQWKKR